MEKSSGQVPFKFLLTLVTTIFATWSVLNLIEFYKRSRSLEDSSTDLKLTLNNTELDHNKHSLKEKLAVIVPFRDCFEELFEFVPHMTKFLNRQGIPHHIFVVNQDDGLRFNRAMLLNVGFLYASDDFDYFALHDIDLLPLNDKLSYENPRNFVLHVAAFYLHPARKFKTYSGGIVIVPKEIYQQVDGMSNNFWGWGMEDDEFRLTVTGHNISFIRPSKKIGSNKSNTFRDIHTSGRERDKTKCNNQPNHIGKRTTESGLKSTLYRMKSVQHASIDNATFTLLNVELICDKKVTPWCDCGE